jgi:hypothetical protein
MGMLADLLTTFSPDRARLLRQTQMLLSENLFRAKGDNLTMLYFAGAALHRLDDASFQTFSKKVLPALARAQDASGSWPTRIETDAIRTKGGPYYVTAISALILQSSYRYPPGF